MVTYRLCPKTSSIEFSCDISLWKLYPILSRKLLYIFYSSSRPTDSLHVAKLPSSGSGLTTQHRSFSILGPVSWNSLPFEILVFRFLCSASVEVWIAGFNRGTPVFGRDEFFHEAALYKFSHVLCYVNLSITSRYDRWS